MSDFTIDGSNILSNSSIDIPEFELKQTYDDDVSYKVARPLSFDVYAMWKPLSTDLIVVRPNLGFAVSLDSNNEFFYFNWGLEGRLSLWRMLMFHIGTGMENDLWRHRAGLGLNFRVIELDIEAGLRAIDFINVSGAGVSIGLRMGF
jgi:hypothetical protein